MIQVNEICFVGDVEIISENLEYLKSLGIVRNPLGRKVELQITTEPILNVKKSETSKIIFQKKAHLFRGLLRWLNMEEETEHSEVVNFNRMGPMIDLSRNGVMKVSAVKRFLSKQARLGLDTCMLYMEDVYEIPEYPYFGYLRGRYSLSELKDLDNYASQLGIELIPCIQTLGHLANPLKWNFANGFKDTQDILLVGEDETYNFIDSILKNMANTFRSKKIHIGMDEAWSLGSGAYLRNNGYRSQFDLIVEHLNKVMKLTEKYNLEPMIWSDMYFRSNSKTSDYYDPAVEFTPEMISQIPKVELVYWDYYNSKKSTVDSMLDKHLQLSSEISFAGGVWTWNGIAPNYGKTIATTEVALSACKEKKISEIYITMWGDDGQETTIDTAWLGLAIFAQYQFAKNESLAGAEEDVSVLLGENPAKYLLLSKFDEIPGISEGNLGGAAPSKILLYQDILMGMFEPNLNKLPLKENYSNLSQELAEISQQDTMIRFYQKLAEVLQLKAKLSTNIRTAYANKNKVEMKEYISTLEKLKSTVFELKNLHFNLWYETYQPFGWEVLDVRYGGLLSRIDTSVLLLNKWLENVDMIISELEVTLLRYDAGQLYEKDPIGRRLYQDIVTPSKLSGV